MIVFNQVQDNTEIDIIGAIGEDFFGDGNTLASVKAEVDQITTPNITVNIDSLGGAVSDGFAIHDLLATHPAKVQANIIGWTASAGTIIAMAADTVNITENNFFLIHNTWTGAVGNANELREVASDLDRFDDKLIGIYKNKTGQRATKIRKLMSEEKWLSAEEAKDFGLIDTISKATKAAASYADKDLTAAGLPTVPERINQNINEMNENKTLVDEFKSLKELVVNFVEGLKAPKEDAVNEVSILDNEEVSAKLYDIETEINTFTEQTNALRDTIETLKADNAAKDAELAKFKGEEINTASEVEPAITDEATVNTWDEVANLFK